MQSKVISVVNQKGGVGKTTTAINLSSILAIMNYKVLLIDLDAQGNTSTGLGISQATRKATSYHMLSNLNSIDETILSTTVPKLDIITANTNLAAIELELSNVPDNETILKNACISVMDSYDYIIIDCPPSLSLLTVNALVFCKEVIIPMLCDFFSLEGLSHLVKTVSIIKKRLNPEIKIAGILFTMYDKRNKLTLQVEQEVRDCFGKLVYNTTIPRNVRLSEAPSHGKAAVIYDHNCIGARAYMRLAKEMLNKTDKIFA